MAPVQTCWGGPLKQSAPRDSAVFEVRDALEQPGCAVCRLALRSVGRFLQAVAYEQVNDPGLRADLRSAMGFCNQHAYRWLREAHNVLGTAFIYRDILLNALQSEPKATGVSNGQWGGLLRALLGADERVTTHVKCPACRAQREAETRYLEALLASAAVDEHTQAAVARSQGLCERHVAWARARGGPGADLLTERTRHVLKMLIGELGEVIRKEDYRFRHEARTDGERMAPQRAIAWAAGIEGLTET